MVHVTISYHALNQRCYSITTSDTAFKRVDIEAELGDGQTWQEHEPRVIAGIIALTGATDITDVEFDFSAPQVESA